jgi:hypothetical protein
MGRIQKPLTEGDRQHTQKQISWFLPNASFKFSAARAGFRLINGIIGNRCFTHSAAPLPDCGHLWHTELLRSDSSILHSNKSTGWRPLIASDGRILPALNSARRQAD